MPTKPPVREGAAEQQRSAKAGLREGGGGPAPPAQSGRTRSVRRRGPQGPGLGPGRTGRPQEVGAEPGLADRGEENQRGVERGFLAEERGAQEPGSRGAQRGGRLRGQTAVSRGCGNQTEGCCLLTEGLGCYPGGRLPLRGRRSHSASA